MLDERMAQTLLVYGQCTRSFYALLSTPEYCTVHVVKHHGLQPFFRMPYQRIEPRG